MRRNICYILSIILIVFNCNVTGVKGPGSVTGKDARARIFAHIQSNLINLLAIVTRTSLQTGSASIYPGYRIDNILLLSIASNIVFKATSGIQDNRLYTESSVESCEQNLENIFSAELHFALFSACNIEEVGVVQIGKYGF